jgi:nucleoside-diphosphate-sugar epimerase
VVPVPRNIYGVTKTAAEDLCELVHRDHGLPCVILRTSRFFPEGDDREDVRARYDDANVKVNELICRRVDLADVVDAHRLALERAPELGFGRFIITATTPFSRDDLAALRVDAPAVVQRLHPEYEEAYAARLADVPGVRPRVRQRPRAPRARLGAALRLRDGDPAPARGRGVAEPAGAGGRLQGVPRGVSRYTASGSSLSLRAAGA